MRDEERKRQRREHEWELNFEFPFLVEITCSKMFSKQLQIGISGNNTSVWFEVCVCVFACLFFYFMGQQNFLHMKMFSHFIWHAMCTAFHWMESFKRAHIEFFVENQTSHRMYSILGTKKLFFALSSYAQILSFMHHTLHDPPAEI